MLALIAAEVDVEANPAYDPPREGDIQVSEADVSLARELIGYEPGVGIEDGIGRTVAWFRDHATLAR